MPSLEERQLVEDLIAERLAAVHTQLRRRVMRELGSDLNVNNLTEATWQQLATRYRDVLVQDLEGLFNLAGTQFGDQLGVDFEFINARAATWAREWVDGQLIPDITGTARTRIEDAVTRFTDGEFDLGTLERRITSQLGPARAELIASTEATRAAVEGELAVVNELRQDGIILIPIWRNVQDGRVCPICAPLEGNKQGTGWILPPPAHGRCRCYLVYEVEDLPAVASVIKFNFSVGDIVDLRAA